MVLIKVVDLDAIMDDLGLKNQEAREAAKQYVEKMEELDELQIETILGTFHDGYVAALEKK